MTRQSSNSEESTHDVSLCVVIPTYRRATRLDRLLTALEPQITGRPDRQVVVVNDGSHDGAYAEIAERFRSMIDYVALPQNRGRAAARNAGARKATGRYLVFTDDDCVPPPHWLDWLVADLQEYPYVAVIGGTTRPLPCESPGLIERYATINGLGPRPNLRYGLLHCVPTANLAIRRDWFERVGGFDDRFDLGEDTNLTSRLRRAGAHFHIDWSWFTYHDQDWSLFECCERWFRYGLGGGLNFGLSGDASLEGRIPASSASVVWGLPRAMGRIRNQNRQSRHPGYLRQIYTALDLLRHFLLQLGLVRGFERAAKFSGRDDSATGRELETGQSPPQPNLLIIGAMKSGTSSLHNYLGAHPSIFMCRPREPNYFVRDIEDRKDEDRYLRLFAAAGNATIIGESSTAYSKLPIHADVPRRIANYSPDARIIYIMRDPVERTISHYWHRVMHEGETRNILEAIQGNPHYRDVSHYVMQLAPYFELFDASQIKTVTTEEMEAHPLAVVRDLYEWLGVDPSFMPLNIARRWHVTPTVVRQVKGWQALLRFRESHIRRTIGWRTIGRMIPDPLRLAGREISEKTVDRSSVSVDEVVDFLRPIQQVQTRELSRILGREFPEWTTLYGAKGPSEADRSMGPSSSGRVARLGPTPAHCATKAESGG